MRKKMVVTKEVVFEELIGALKMCFRKEQVFDLTVMKLSVLRVKLVRVGNTRTTALTEVEDRLGEVSQGVGTRPHAIILGNLNSMHVAWVPREKDFTDYILLQLEEAS